MYYNSFHLSIWESSSKLSERIKASSDIVLNFKPQLLLTQKTYDVTLNGTKKVSHGVYHQVLIS